MSQAFYNELELLLSDLGVAIPIKHTMLDDCVVNIEKAREKVAALINVARAAEDFTKNAYISDLIPNNKDTRMWLTPLKDKLTALRDADKPETPTCPVTSKMREMTAASRELLDKKK